MPFLMLLLIGILLTPFEGSAESKLTPLKGLSGAKLNLEFYITGDDCRIDKARLRVIGELILRQSRIQISVKKDVVKDMFLEFTLSHFEQRAESGQRQFRISASYRLALLEYEVSRRNDQIVEQVYWQQSGVAASDLSGCREFVEQIYREKMEEFANEFLKQNQNLSTAPAPAPMQQDPLPSNIPTKNL